MVLNIHSSSREKMYFWAYRLSCNIYKGNIKSVWLFTARLQQVPEHSLIWKLLECMLFSG
jgi:hypothetical protein